MSDRGNTTRALVLNRREDAVGTLLSALSGDVSIPFTESLRLAEASAGRANAVILETFEHTRAQSFWATLDGRLRDGRRLLGLADALLAEP